MDDIESPEEWLKKITATGPHDIAPALWNDIRRCVNSMMLGTFSSGKNLLAGEQ